MPLSCEQAQKALADLKESLADFKKELKEFTETGDRKAGEDLALGVSMMRKDAKELREKLTTTPYLEAKEMFENEFFVGYEVARELFDVNTPDTKEPIPFSRHALLEAKEQGKILIYRPLGMHRIQDICQRFLDRKNPNSDHHMDWNIPTLIATEYEKYSEEANKRWQRSEFLTPGWSLIDTSELDETKTVRSMSFDRPRMADIIYDIIASRLVYGSLMNRGPVVTKDKEVEQNGRIAGYDSFEMFEDSIELGIKFSLVGLDRMACTYGSVTKNR